MVKAYKRYELSDLINEGDYGTVAVIFRYAKAGSRTRKYIAAELPPKITSPKQARALSVMCLKKSDRPSNALHDALVLKMMA